MQCPSCGEQTYGTETCIKCGHVNNTISPDNLSDSSPSTQQTKSTLIEFPGVKSSLPEWRRELSVRVREVQERKAKEAAREAAEAERQLNEPMSSTSQLELLRQAEAPAINPLVAAALKRIERANQTISAENFQQRAQTATAVAYNPSLEIQDTTPPVETTTESEISQTVTSQELRTTTVEVTKNRGLVVVQPIANAAEKRGEKPKRLIVDDPNDPVLNYLDSVSRTLRVDEVPNQRASVLRRLACAIFDLMTCVLLSTPILLAFTWSGVDLTEARPLSVLIGVTLVLTFLYFTLSIGLTGRTWAMRMFSLRVVDLRTGLIPTGSQSASRAFFYLLSLSLAGLGILYALVSRDGETMHDRFTRTAVIKI